MSGYLERLVARARGERREEALRPRRDGRAALERLTAIAPLEEDETLEAPPSSHDADPKGARKRERAASKEPPEHLDRRSPDAASIAAPPASKLSSTNPTEPVAAPVRLRTASARTSGAPRQDRGPSQPDAVPTRATPKRHSAAPASAAPETATARSRTPAEPEATATASPKVYHRRHAAPAAHKPERSTEDTDNAGHGEERDTSAVVVPLRHRVAKDGEHEPAWTPALSFGREGLDERDREPRIDVHIDRVEVVRPEPPPSVHTAASPRPRQPRGFASLEPARRHNYPRWS